MRIFFSSVMSGVVGLMRGVHQFLLLSFGLVLSARLAAATSINLVWTGTSGSGSIGSSSISVSATEPETLTLEMILDVDGLGLSYLQVSVQFDRDLRDELDLLSIETLSWSNPKGPGNFIGLGFETSQESDATAGGEIVTFQGFTLGLGPRNTTLTFARMVFATNPSNLSNDGPDVFSLFLTPDDRALFVTCNGVCFFDVHPEFGSAEVNVIPEPLPLSLLGLGIGVLALAGRRGHNTQ